MVVSFRNCLQISFLILIEFKRITSTLFYKQLVLGLTPQSCLYFQGFQGSKLLNGGLVV